MILIDNSFWTSVGVVMNDGNPNGNQYDFYNSIEMSNGETIYNQYEFFKNSPVDGVYYNDQYDWYRAVGVLYSEPIIDEYSFYQNVSVDGVNPVENQFEFFKGLIDPVGLTSFCSYYFNGTDADAALGSHINSTIEGAATFSIRMVARFLDVGTNQFILTNNPSGNASFRLQRDAATNKVWVWLSSNGTVTNVSQSSYIIDNTNWFELIFTYNNGVITNYLNGVSYGYAQITGAIPTSLHSTGQPMKLASVAGSVFGNLYVNQLQITSDVITPSEASNLYGGGTPLVGGDSLDNVVADYIFDNDPFDGTDFTLIDRTGNGNGITNNIDAVDKDCNENPY